ncbi:telomere stability/silencing protein [Gregarina niphandrodes]|uniref:Telomere stability/silencing protein n=1 Tax=Gregarina niphandrodes TaxID=110365 RepID=A0A023BDI1_GRENI|nr:telomere stability/silencing protein [Gregarina niphandrodes]EZG88351.1 telomere stability/silencing protein [Gregarina niphandrodes]|eukprot:XP_011128578.1 telomere stability/silencing protein [Gregarina niphandrodes]
MTASYLRLQGTYIPLDPGVCAGGELYPIAAAALGYEILPALQHRSKPPFYLKRGGKVLSSDSCLDADSVQSNVVFDVALVTLGGKGGFGSMLKKKGMKVKVHNFESSRDLSGRRIRDAEAAKKAKALQEQKDWEDELIRSLGGEDQFKGKSLSAIDVIQKYAIHLHPDSADPFDIVEQAQPKHDELFAEVAAECAQAAPAETGDLWSFGPSPQVSSTTNINSMELGDLDIDIDIEI